MKFGVAVFPGTWSDRDCGWVIDQVLPSEVELRYLWHKDRDLKDVDCVILPGGFSYGDYLRTGAIARFAPLMDAVAEFAERGGLVWGICNGFQILCEAGLLPGVLIQNAGLEFRCEWTNLLVERTDTPFTAECRPRQVLRIPISHGEGNYFADPPTLSRLEQNGQVVLRYCAADGLVVPAANPNGSVHNIAGIVNERGNVLGMMPHPERCAEAELGGTDGLLMFKSVAACTGYFLVLRGQTFAGHALAHVGFAGATGAVLLGISPLWGLLGSTVAGGLGMGILGERLEGRDVAIGIVLAVSLGLGLLFLHFFTAYASQATALLFGNLLGVDARTVVILGALAALCLLGLAFIGRPLLFASLQPELAEARGVPLRTVAMIFLAIVAVATAECAQIVGVLLVFALMVAPAAAAQRLTRRIGPGVLLAVVLALADAWGGLALAYHTDWPSSFWITALGGITYLAAAAVTH